MNKDQILEISRHENKSGDEMIKDVNVRAGKAAGLVGALVCGIIIIIETSVIGKANMSVWAVYLSMLATVNIVKYIHLKKTSSLIFGILEIALAIINFGIYLTRLMR